MTKLQEQSATRTTPEHRPDVLEDLPELPDSVVVPDDISGLELPATLEPSRSVVGIRWLRWLPVVVLMAAGALVAALLVRDGQSEPTADVGSVVVPQQEAIATGTGHPLGTNAIVPQQEAIATGTGHPLGTNAIVPQQEAIATGTGHPLGTNAIVPQQEAIATGTGHPLGTNAIVPQQEAIATGTGHPLGTDVGR